MIKTESITRNTMIDVKDEGIVLDKSDMPFENQAVLNPACIDVAGVTHMYYRAVRREGRVSSIGYCQLADGKLVYRSPKPVLEPEHDYERGGVEDPRIVLLEGVFYLFYTAFDGKNALIAYATSPDLVTWTKRGVISPRITYDEAEDLFRKSHVRDKYAFFESYFKDIIGKDGLLWEKDGFIFPEKIDGKFALLHRILPGIQLAYFDDFNRLDDAYWREHLSELNSHILLDSEYKFENRNIGGGCPPVRTKDGWLLIYHAVEDRPHGRVYHAAAALLDLKDPMKVIGRLPHPLFSPQTEAKQVGDVNNVVFPTSAIVRGDRLFVYYGAADSRIMCKSMLLEELLTELRSHSPLHAAFTVEPFAKTVEKPWGREIIYTPPRLSRTGKILEVRKGQKLSFQYHERKEETLCLLNGACVMWLENAAGDIEKFPMVQHKGYTVQIMQKHRVEATEDSVLIEVSSPERGATFRLSDDYGRKDETEAARNAEREGS